MTERTQERNQTMNNSIRLAAVLAGLAVCICLCLAACRKETPGGENTATDTAGVGSDMSDTPGESTDLPVPVVKKAVIAGGGASTKIYSEIVGLADKKDPKVIILCTAGKDTVSNVEAYVNTFKRLTKNVEAITLVTKLYDPQELHDKIVNADIICVGGGQSEYMDMVWKKFKVNEYLVEAYNKGVICCGGSAGGMCWTYMGWNDYYSVPDSIYKFFPGLDVVNIYYGPHFDSSDKWAEFDRAIMKETSPKYDLGFAMDNGTAIVFIDGVPTRSVREKETSRIIRYDFRDGKWTRSVYTD